MSGQKPGSESQWKLLWSIDEGKGVKWLIWRAQQQQDASLSWQSATLSNQARGALDGEKTKKPKGHSNRASDVLCIDGSISLKNNHLSSPPNNWPFMVQRWDRGHCVQKAYDSLIGVQMTFQGLWTWGQDSLCWWVYNWTLWTEHQVVIYRGRFKRVSAARKYEGSEYRDISVSVF